MPSTIQKLGQRRIVQWAIAYVLGAWVLLQVAESLASIFALSGHLLKMLVILLVFGFTATLVLAWYHGEQGRQQLSSVELALLFAIAVLTISFLTTVEFGPGRCGAGQPGPTGAWIQPERTDIGNSPDLVPSVLLSPVRDERPDVSTSPGFPIHARRLNTPEADGEGCPTEKGDEVQDLIPVQPVRFKFKRD